MMDEEIYCECGGELSRVLIGDEVAYKCRGCGALGNEGMISSRNERG